MVANFKKAPLTSQKGSYYKVNLFQRPLHILGCRLFNKLQKRSNALFPSVYSYFALGPSPRGRSWRSSCCSTSSGPAAMPFPPAKVRLSSEKVKGTSSESQGPNATLDPVTHAVSVLSVEGIPGLFKSDDQSQSPNDFARIS